MERKKKSALCNKVISLFTSLLMVLSTIIGYIPTSAVSVSAADGYPLQEVSSGTKLITLKPDYDPENDIFISPTPDKIKKYSADNDDFDKNKDGSLWTDKSKRYLRIRTKSGFANFDGKQWNVPESKFHPTITYYKAGYDKKHNQYYNLTMRVEKYESDGYIWYMADSSTRDKQYSKITTKPECPYIYIDTKKSSVGISGLKNVQCSFTWSKYIEGDESEAIPDNQVKNLTSYITIRDLDDGQAMKIAGNQKGSVDVYKLKGSKFINEQDGWYVSKSGETTSPSDKKSWVQTLLTGSQTFIMWFRANEPNKVVHDTEYNKQWGMPANTCYSWNKNNAGMISGNYFEYTAESLINPEPPKPTPTPGGDPEPNDPSIEKVVVQKGGSYDDAYKAASPEDAFEINDYDDYDYLIKTAGPGAETDSYEIVDTLEDCLTIDDTHHITITDKDGTNVSNDFNLSIKGQTITASAKADYMKSSDFKKADQEFMVRLTVHRIKTKDVYTFMAPWIANDSENTGYTFYVPNASTVRYHVKDAKETTQLDSDNDTEQSMTEDEILANAGIDLDEDGTDSDGDTDLDLPELNGDQDGTGDSGDTDLPDGTNPEEHEPTPAEEMTVTGIPDSFDDHVAGTADKTNDVDESLWNETVTTPITKELTQVGNGWELKISNLPAGNDVNIRFTCEALEAGNGAEGVNVGTVSATNGIEKSDDAEAYINTAALSIDKQMVNKYAAGGEEDAQDGREGYEFRVGDDVEYKLVVNNNQKGSIARNVVISDTTIPVGMELDESSITVEGVPETYVNPVAGTDDPANQLDPDHYNETSVEPVNYNVERVNGGFQVTIDNLPCTTGDTLNNVTTPVVITYHCTPGSILNGYEVINTGKAAADNASEVKDSERIWINSPELKVIKDSDRYEYMVGDTVTYQVDVTQEQAGCLARDITITDVIDTEGVKLQKNSIVLIDEDGNKIEPESVEVNGNTFTVNTGRNLINNKSGYTTVDMSKADDEKGDSGYFQNGEYNPLGIDKESKLTLEYAVEITDEDLAGQSIHNTVTANSKENIPVEDEHEVLVYGPALDIVKESDKVEYQVGEKAQYKLTIRELRDNITAKQVVVTDTFEKEGMKISKINVRLNGEKLDGAEIEQTADNAFVINTGADLTIEDKLEVFYTVVFTDPSLHDQDIVNVATAKGENTEEERQDNCVHIVDETPGLEIKKTSDKTSYKVGETGHYTVVVSNTEKGTTARNVIIKDALQVEGAKIVDGSIKIYNDAGKLMDDAEIGHSDTDYAIATGHDLEYKEQFTVNYDVLFEAETLAGKDILNVARATCDNLRVETKTPSPIKLANGLEVYKSADPATGSVVKNGDTINYSINVKNTSNDDVKNVLVKDMIPEHTEYASSEEQDGVVTGTRTLNDKLYATFVIESLPAGEEKTVSFAVTVTDAPQEAMILNVAQVRVTKFALDDQTDNIWTHEAFRNTNETVHYTDTRWVKDQNVVYIDGGKLSIEKSSDKMNYSVGETGHYTVSVKQKVEGAVARNVVVADKLQKKGAYIQKDSIKAYILREGAEEPEEIEDVQLVAKDFEYTLYTNTNLKYGEEILVKYDVLFKDAELEGQQIKNVALTKDDSTVPGDEPTDTNRVTVGDAGLIIAKSSDKTKYKVGDVGKYTLKVTAADQSRTIKNVVVKDVMKQKGAHLVTGTVRTYYDNEELKVDVQEKDNGFVVETKHDLSGTHAIYVTYDVVFEEASLDGRDVTNIATTWGDNTNPSDDDHTVHVGDGDTPDTPDKPDKPDTPDTPDKPGVGGMTITKTANKNEVSVGDVVSYTLSATVNSGKETAKNVVITDTLDADLFEHLEIVKDSFRSYLDDSEFHGADLSISSTGFTLKSGKDMKPGQVMKVTYDVKVKDDTLKGKTFKNIATVSSDNMDTAKDKESVKVKTDDPVEGGMTISKKANQSKVSVGDTVSYTLEAKVNSGTDTAKNVVIKDTVDSAYAKYVSIDRSSVHCYIDNSEFAPKSLDVTENGFTVTSGKDLKPGQVMKVTYDMKVVSDKLKGKSIKNAAVVSSDNMNPGNDTEIVEVPSDKPVTGGLNLTKIGDHSQINVGDTVKYTLIGKTTSADTAVNVVIKDALDNKGVIDESSIKAYLDDQLFTPKKLSVTDDGFTMETGKDLAAKQILKVTYSVRFADESLAGKTVKNTAVISSDNMDPVDADHGVTVNPKEEEKPALSIDKSVNLSSASVGDTLSYTLTVKETEKDQTAKNVVVRDNFDTTGMKVGGIQATLDGKSIKADVTKADNGFVVNTNTDLAYGSTLKITYQAVVSDSSLAGKMVGNTAIASADNADDVAANAGVSIAENPSPSETPAPSTTPAPGADSSDNTTNTVGPKTGLVNHAGMYAGIGLGIVAVAAIAVFVMRRKKK